LESSTYEIDLLLCGCVQTIPDGSYMQVAFGFPAGYGPEDAGATFKLFHYKSDGSVEEIPCVVTEYGIIATVSSFSPYAVVAFDSSKVSSTTKSAYARTVGLGGEVTVAKNGTADHGVVGVTANDTITYTFVANEGYKAERIVLNGKETILTNGQTSVTYSYADLANDNVLEVYFVANTVADYEAANGITPVYASVKATLPIGDGSDSIKNNGSTGNGGNAGDNNNGNTGDDNNNGNTGDVGNGNTGDIGNGSGSTTTPSNEGGMANWLKAVIAVAVVLAVAAIVTVIVTLIRRKNYKDE
jgi:hypothetical protein